MVTPSPTAKEQELQMSIAGEHTPQSELIEIPGKRFGAGVGEEVTRETISEFRGLPSDRLQSLTRQGLSDEKIALINVILAERRFQTQVPTQRLQSALAEQRGVPGTTPTPTEEALQMSLPADIRHLTVAEVQARQSFAPSASQFFTPAPAQEPLQSFAQQTFAPTQSFALGDAERLAPITMRSEVRDTSPLGFFQRGMFIAEGIKGFGEKVREFQTAPTREQLVRAGAQSRLSKEFYGFSDEQLRAFAMRPEETGLVGQSTMGEETFMFFPTKEQEKRARKETKKELGFFKGKAKDIVIGGTVGAIGIGEFILEIPSQGTRQIDPSKGISDEPIGFGKLISERERVKELRSIPTGFSGKAAEVGVGVGLPIAVASVGTIKALKAAKALGLTKTEALGELASGVSPLQIKGRVFAPEPAMFKTKIADIKVGQKGTTGQILEAEGVGMSEFKIKSVSLAGEVKGRSFTAGVSVTERPVTRLTFDIFEGAKIKPSIETTVLPSVSTPVSKEFPAEALLGKVKGVDVSASFPKTRIEETAGRSLLRIRQEQTLGKPGTEITITDITAEPPVSAKTFVGQRSQVKQTIQSEKFQLSIEKSAFAAGEDIGIKPIRSQDLLRSTLGLEKFKPKKGGLIDVFFGQPTSKGKTPFIPKFRGKVTSIEVLPTETDFGLKLPKGRGDTGRGVDIFRTEEGGLGFESFGKGKIRQTTVQKSIQKTQSDINKRVTSSVSQASAALKASVPKATAKTPTITQLGVISGAGQKPVAFEGFKQTGAFKPLETTKEAEMLTPRIESKLFQDIGLDVRPKQAPKPAFASPQAVGVAPAVSTRQLFGTVQVPREIVITRQKLGTETPPTTGRAVSPPFTFARPKFTFFPFPPIAPPLGFGDPLKGTVKSKRKLKRQPSLISSILDIKGEELPKLEETGLVIRPLISRKRKKRK